MSFECTEFVGMEVSGAGSSEANGIYIPFSTVSVESQIHTLYTKDGLDSYPRIQPKNYFANLWRWLISTGPTTHLYFGGWNENNSTFSASIEEGGQNVNCPSSAFWFTGFSSLGDTAVGLEPLPTVTGLLVLPEPEPSSNTFGLPAETVALLTKNFGSVANFLRLRNQGQV